MKMQKFQLKWKNLFNWIGNKEKIVLNSGTSPLSLAGFEPGYLYIVRNRNQIPIRDSAKNSGGNKMSKELKYKTLDLAHQEIGIKILECVDIRVWTNKLKHNQEP